MNSDETTPEAVARAILDGTGVDWNAVECAATPPERPVLRGLRAIAAIAAAQADDMPETWGPLRLRERVGRGAFGDVYRAWDPRLDREVALKLMPAEAAAADGLATCIIEEGRLLARVRHPNVVTIYGAERIDDRVGLWMEYVDGLTLHQLVATEGRRFSPAEVIALGRTLCGAVEAVHAAGLLHRDIKAQNVMIGNDDRVALMDFGAGDEVRAPSKAAMAGTPLYLAPELVAGASAATVRSDVYSTGVLLFFLLTGSYPVIGDDLEGLKAAHALGERQLLKALRPDVPRALRRVIARATDPDPARRYPSAAALGAALGRASVARRTTIGSLAAATLVMAALALTRSGAPVAGRGERPQIAILPLANLAAGTEGDDFADGLTDDIIRNLGAVRGLDVRSHTSSFAFKGRRRAIARVGRELRVGYVLDGSVSRAGNHLRVNAQLLQVDGEVPIWSEQFDRQLTVPDILAIQDDISRAIVNRLRLTLNGGQRRYETSLETYELFLRARALAERQGDTDPLRAMKLFEKVIEQDRTFAPAYAGIVLAYAYLSMGPYQGVPYEKAQPAMRAAAMEAARLDPMAADTQAAEGWVLAREFRWQEAERSFRRAIEINPNLISTYTSFTFSTLQPLNRLTEAERLLRNLAERDPQDSDIQRALARVLLEAGRAAEAVKVLEPLMQTDASLPRVDSLLGRALVLDGRPLESLPLLERRRERVLNPQGGLHPWVAFAYVKLGRRADAEKLARENDHLPYRRAIINAALGNTERTFDGLRQMAEEEPQRLVILLRAPELAPYRRDPRFTALLHRFNLEP